MSELCTLRQARIGIDMHCMHALNTILVHERRKNFAHFSNEVSKGDEHAFYKSNRFCGIGGNKA